MMSLDYNRIFNQGTAVTAYFEILPCGPLRASIRPPGSKSITNRALVCAALAEGDSLLTGALESDDTQVMITALRQLGIGVNHDPAARTVQVAGVNGRIPASRALLYVGNSGTTIRFLTAMVALGHGVYRLEGKPRMAQRPIKDLLDALRQLGADATSEFGTDCPPVLVRADGLHGGPATVAGNLSSQFLSGLLMAAPYAREPVELFVQGDLVSQPYVEMTLAVMEAFGVSVQRQPRRFRIPTGQRYRGRQYAIEPDASAAGYFFAAAAVTGGRVTVEGLSKSSLQGDVAFCDCLQKMGCTVDYQPDAITITGQKMQGIDVNMNALSDTVQTLSAVALFADGPTTIHGVTHIRYKETDRISNLARELRKLGADVDEHDDGLRILPQPLHAAEIETYDDHRMAMSLALVGLKIPGVKILNPSCTAKTYPGFFKDLERICGTNLE
jgi:3-phosphoshikimate 1-carboxyvinyltransferase